MSGQMDSFSVRDLIARLGVTHGELQWSDEQGIVIPHNRRSRTRRRRYGPDGRLYMFEQAIQTGVVKELRRVRFSPGFRGSVDYSVKTILKRISKLFGVPNYLVVTTTQPRGAVHGTQSKAEAIELMCRLRSGVILIDVAEIRQKLGGQLMRAESDYSIEDRTRRLLENAAKEVILCPSCKETIYFVEHRDGYLVDYTADGRNHRVYCAAQTRSKRNEQQSLIDTAPYPG